MPPPMISANTATTIFVAFFITLCPPLKMCNHNLKQMLHDSVLHQKQCIFVNDALIILAEVFRLVRTVFWQIFLLSDIALNQYNSSRPHTKDKYHLRGFTPGGEIDLCGHATFGTIFVIINFYLHA